MPPLKMTVNYEKIYIIPTKLRLKLSDYLINLCDQNQKIKNMKNYQKLKIKKVLMMKNLCLLLFVGSGVVGDDLSNTNF